MEQFTRYFSILIVLGFFTLGTLLLLHPYFSYLNKEIRVVFAVFLYLYGFFRMVRIFLKIRKKNDP